MDHTNQVTRSLRFVSFEFLKHLLLFRSGSIAVIYYYMLLLSIAPWVRALAIRWVDISCAHKKYCVHTFYDTNGFFFFDFRQMLLDMALGSKAPTSSRHRCQVTAALLLIVCVTLTNSGKYLHFTISRHTEVITDCGNRPFLSTFRLKFYVPMNINTTNYCSLLIIIQLQHTVIYLYTLLLPFYIFTTPSRTLVFSDISANMVLFFFFFHIQITKDAYVYIIFITIMVYKPLIAFPTVFHCLYYAVVRSIQKYTLYSRREKKIT